MSITRHSVHKVFQRNSSFAFFVFFYRFQVSSSIAVENLKYKVNNFREHRGTHERGRESEINTKLYHKEGEVGVAVCVVHYFVTFGNIFQQSTDSVFPLRFKILSRQQSERVSSDIPSGCCGRQQLSHPPPPLRGLLLRVEMFQKLTCLGA